MRTREKGKDVRCLPVSSLPSPVEIINEKLVATVLMKQAPNLVTSQAEGCMAVSGFAERDVGVLWMRKGGGHGISVKAGAW